MKRKCCFIIPYFGKIPKSFSVFLKTCEYNKEFNWLLLTDDHKPFDYPANFIVKYTTLQTISKLADEKFGFHVSLEKSYKLCDFKPAYGFLFEEYLQGFRFWGHCDIDTIMGNLSEFLTDELLDQYDKLFCMGHMILYRNTFINNRLFMSPYNGKLLYKEVFTTPEICWFDEEWNGNSNVNRIFLSEGKKVLLKDWSANFNVNKQRFEREIACMDEETQQIEHICEGKKDALYCWENGNACRYYVEGRKLKKEYFLYMHFQWRNMRFTKKILTENQFKIVPNAFLKLSELPKNIYEFRKIRKATFCFYKLKRIYIMSILRRLKKIVQIFNNIIQGKES